MLQFKKKNCTPSFSYNNSTKMTAPNRVFCLILNIKCSLRTCDARIWHTTTAPLHPTPAQVKRAWPPQKHTSILTYPVKSKEKNTRETIKGKIKLHTRTKGEEWPKIFHFYKAISLFFPLPMHFQCLISAIPFLRKSRIRKLIVSLWYGCSHAITVKNN